MLNDIVLFIAVGFAAQLVDGAIGMAYGLISTTILLSLGVSPASASASVHIAEIFTTAASGMAHWKLGNIRFELLWKLAIPGMIGGAIGAYILVSFPGDTLRPYVSFYLLAMGLIILWKAIKRFPLPSTTPRQVPLLGFSGGLLDAIGGGGWGPLVTSTLVGSGHSPRFTIGTVNLAEFFVTIVISATFVATIGIELWQTIAGLILGGILAAPFAAYATRRIPDRPLMILVAVVIILLSFRGIVKAFV